MSDLDDIISIIEDRADNGDFLLEEEAIDVISALLDHFGEDVKYEIKEMLVKELSK